MTASTNRPGIHALLPGQTPEGKFVMAVLLKRTYKIIAGKPCVRTRFCPSSKLVTRRA